MYRLVLAVALLPVFSASAATVAHPTVVELFTSQGCSSCPPANANLRALADRPGVLALSFDVTYWDHLGWKDIFAKQEFTERQIAYEAPLGERGPFTPQIVVDGRADAVGNVRSEVEALIAKSAHGGEPQLSIAGGKISIGAGARTKADVWLVRYDPRVQSLPVGAGENSGANFVQKNVVRSLARLGEWTGVPVEFAIAPAGSGLRSAVLVQAGPGGPILAAAGD